MAKFEVTIRKVILTKVTVEAADAGSARAQIRNYGVVEAASDMATEDEITAFIKSVKAL